MGTAKFTRKRASRGAARRRRIVRPSRGWKPRIPPRGTLGRAHPSRLCRATIDGRRRRTGACVGSFVRVVLVIAALVIVVAVLAVPIAASQLAGDLAREAGFSGSNLKVSVDLLGPQLLSGTAPSVHLEG